MSKELETDNALLAEIAAVQKSRRMGNINAQYAVIAGRAMLLGNMAVVERMHETGKLTQAMDEEAVFDCLKGTISAELCAFILRNEIISANVTNLLKLESLAEGQKELNPEKAKVLLAEAEIMRDKLSKTVEQLPARQIAEPEAFAHRLAEAVSRDDR